MSENNEEIDDYAAQDLEIMNTMHGSNKAFLIATNKTCRNNRIDIMINGQIA